MSTHDDEIDEQLIENERDVGGLRRHLRKVLGEVKKWKEKARALEANKPKPESEMTPAERFDAASNQFWVDNAHRMTGLTGDAREAMGAALVDEYMASPFVKQNLESIRSEGNARLEKLNANLQRLTRESAARSFAMSIAKPGCAEALLPIVLNRLGCEERGDDMAIFVTGADGKPSGASLDALADELRATPAFKPVIAGATAEEVEAHARKVQAAITPAKA